MFLRIGSNSSRYSVFDALSGYFSNLEITVPLYSEHWVLHPHRREERKRLELQSLAHGEVGS